LNLKFQSRTCRYTDRNFKFAALVALVARCVYVSRRNYSEAVSIHQRPNGRLTKLPVLAAAIDG
jgi:hypothetical protein